MGWTLARRVDGDLFLGWVPEAIGGADILSATAKLTWAPASLARGGWRLRPTTAVQLTWTFGDRYHVVPPEPFLPTALRTGVGLGGEVSRAVGGRRVALYAELVAVDVPLAYWLTNRGAVDARDVFSLALGLRVEL